MKKKRGHVFYCSQFPEYMLWTGSRFLEFHQGCLVTDEMGATAIKQHPMWGRLFTDVPPDPINDPHPELRLADRMMLPTDTYDCPECSEVFSSQYLMNKHRLEAHHMEADDGERQGSSGEDEVRGEGQDERNAG